jgi:hypothetical protein
MVDIYRDQQGAASKRLGKKRYPIPRSTFSYTEEMVISVGDQIRITEGFRERGVAFRTNDIAKVKAVELDQIELEDGRRLKRDFVHIDQGVCITSYASECRTVRQMVTIAPVNSFSEMHAKTFYVLASRATHRAGVVQPVAVCREGADR